MLNKIKIVVDKGTIALGKEGMQKVIAALDGEYIVYFYEIRPKNIEEWRKYYFFLRDTLFEDGETGYTRKELHEIGKATILPILSDNDLCFLNAGRDSTSSLSEHGWQEYVKLYKEWAFESFNCYL